MQAPLSLQSTPKPSGHSELTKVCMEEEKLNMTTQTIAQTQPRVRIDKMAQAARICLLMAALIVFNVYPDKVGTYRTILDSSSFTPLLASGFYAALPWLNAWWVLALGLATTLVFLERWTLMLRFADLALDILGITVVCRLLGGDPLVVRPQDSNWLWNANLFPLGARSLWSADTVVLIVLITWLVLLVLSALGKAGRLLSDSRPRRSGSESS
jgi:hypothetical protein